MSTSQVHRRMTADELLRLPSGRYRYELIDGGLRVMELAGGEHGYVAGEILAELRNYVKANDLGMTFAAGTGFLLRTNPDTVRAPDAAFVRKDRIQQIREPEKFLSIPPDLAVEVASPGDSPAYVENKAFDWLDAGVSMVITVDPRARTVRLYRARDDVEVLTQHDILDGADVVPGWRLRVGDVFD